MKSWIIDRRKNPGNKNLPNRQRFLDRAKQSLKASVRKALGGNSITDEGDVNVQISSDGIEEPQFAYERGTGYRDYVLPGNDKYIPGDRIPKEEEKQSGGGSGGGSDGSGDRVNDEFEFHLSYDEYLKILFEDLELPDLVKKSQKEVITYSKQRAGYTNTGVPANLNIEKTMISGLARRIALKYGKQKKLKELQELLQDYKAILYHGNRPDPEECERFEEEIVKLEKQIEELKKRIKKIPFLDTVDIRYNNFIKIPKPATKAVMICILDVSYSMDEEKKIIAKKFFLLLNRFLRVKYKRVDVVFIRHHDIANVCDEENFFRSRESGGTVVSTAYEEALKVIRNKYNPDEWNIYISQASDGDNAYSDNDKAIKILTEELLPKTQYFTYLEVNDEDDTYYTAFGFYHPVSSKLLNLFKLVAKEHKNVAYAHIRYESEVLNIFRNFFKKKDGK